MVRILTAELLDLTFLALESHQASAVEEVPSVALETEADSEAVEETVVGSGNRTESSPN